jgi:hypothetical protein
MEMRARRTRIVAELSKSYDMLQYGEETDELHLDHLSDDRLTFRITFSVPIFP